LSALRSRKLDREAGTISWTTFDFNLAFMSLHDLSANIETESQARDIFRLAGSLEALENPALAFFRNSDAVIPNRKGEPLARSVDPNLNGLSGSVLNRVRKQVGEDLLDLAPIPPANRVSHALQTYFASGSGKFASIFIEDFIQERL